MLVKVKYKDIICRTEKAVLLLVSEHEVWIPASAIRWGPGKSILCHQSLAEKKKMKFTSFTHIPEKMIPVQKQGPIDDLVY